MKTLIALFVAAALAAPVIAQSADGFIVADISLQSGPDPDYPPVDELAAGTPVVIEGCIEGWTWCDVIVGDLRGWVPGTYIEENYDGRWVYITDYGPRIGLPIVVFSLDAYWGTHYRNRPWFGEHERWANRAIHPRMPTRPPGEAHAPPQRPMQATRPMQSTAPAANPPSQLRGTPQTNPGVVPNTERRSIESNAPRETKSPIQEGAPISRQPERATPQRMPTSEPARRTPPPAPKSTNAPQPKPEAKPKGEKPAVKKENQQDHREENNGHDG